MDRMELELTSSAKMEFRKRRRWFTFMAVLSFLLLLYSYHLGAYKALAMSVLALTILEGMLQILIRKLAIPNGIVATLAPPAISPHIVRKFVDHGHDPELGWIRKANTSKIDCGNLYKIDEIGSRDVPCPASYSSMISTYGDSYVFCREVKDEETWQFYLTQRTKTKVLNFGVGNYGFDQALLRLKREYDKAPTPIVIMGFVPQTIARNLSVWKHYNEYGNTLAFKPVFQLKDRELIFHPNPVDSPEKFHQLDRYLPQINSLDFFYAHRFIKEAYSFPFLFSTLYSPKRALLLAIKMARNILGRLGKFNSFLDKLAIWSQTEGVMQTSALFRNPYAINLLNALIDEFLSFSREKGFRPVLLMMPMKDDLIHMKRFGHFYRDFVASLLGKIETIDLAERMLSEKHPHSLFEKWHYNSRGNWIVSDEILRHLNENGINGQQENGMNSGNIAIPSPHP